MIIKLIDNRLVPMGEYCYPEWLPQYLPRKQKEELRLVKEKVQVEDKETGFVRLVEVESERLFGLYDENGIPLPADDNDEMVQVGQRRNKKCQHCADCEGCYELVAPADYSGDPNIYDYTIDGTKLRLTTLKDSYLRARRQAECYSIVNQNYIINGKSVTWYDTLTAEQQADAMAWVQAWRDVTATKVVPTKPAWL